LSHHHQGLLKRFRGTGGFFNNSAIIHKLIVSEKTNLLDFEENVVFLQKNKDNFLKNVKYS